MSFSLLDLATDKLCFCKDPHRRKSPRALLREQLADEGLFALGDVRQRGHTNLRCDLVCDQFM